MLVRSTDLLFALQRLEWPSGILEYHDRVITANVKFPAFDCQLECQVNICIMLYGEDCLYSRSGHLTPHSHSECISCCMVPGALRVGL